MKINIKLKAILAVASFIAGIAFGMMGILINPMGEIHSSVLIMTGQLLVLSATFLGLDVNFDLHKQHFIGGKHLKDKKKQKHEEEDGDTEA